MEPLIASLAVKPDLDKIKIFRKPFTGELLSQGDSGYHEARKVWNGMIDRHPFLIARCKNKNDVIAAVKFARENSLLVSVRGGGHNITGNAVCDDGLMIDLSLMNAIQIDPKEKTAIVETGATWGQFDKEAQKYGLATTGGVISSTGVAGLTLGGGVGWLVRQHGLSCDNLLEAEIVLADGSVVTANKNDNPELFWGVRGGGGNFGIVVSMKFQMHKIDTVFGGMILHAQKDIKEALQFYREFVKTMPEELTLYLGVLTSPDGIPVVAFMACYAGELEKGEAALKSLREFGSPLADLIAPIPYLQMQQLLDAAAPHGNRYYWKSNFLEELSDQAIEVAVKFAETIASPYSFILLEYYGAAANREPEGGTAYPHRLSQFDFVVASNWINREDDEKNTSWTRNFWESMQPFSSHRVYVNLLGVEGEDRVKEAYGKNYSRLVALKNKYDPTNFFRLNQNIKPA